MNSFLDKELLEKLSLIISQSKQFMRINHQKKLTKEIILNSISTLKFPKNKITKDELFLLEEEKDNEDNININDYINEPLIKKPLDTMVFYHWFCINGLCPKTSVNKLDNKKVSLNNSSKNDISNITNNKLIKDNHDLIIKMTKNISKELISFANNFEKIFQNVIKDEFIAKDKNTEFNFEINKEMEINATIIKSEPEIIQLFPYLIAFLEENIKNKEIMKLAKMQYIILYHIKAISVNKYFNLITYMNNILELLMALLLYSNNIDDNNIKESMLVKNEIIIFLNDLMKSKFNKYIPDLMYSISHFVFPQNNNINISYPILLKSLSSIKCINSFGYEYIVNYVYQNIIAIKSYIDQPIIFKYKNKIIVINKNRPQQQIQNQNNINQSNQNSQSQSSIPFKSFTIPFSNDFGIQMSASNFVGESVIQSFWPNNNNINEKYYFKVSDNKEDENLCKENLISYLYIEIFRAIEIVINEMIARGASKEQFELSKNELVQIFGENLVNLFLNNNI